jgi:lipopolysaccharide export system protein LptA
MKVLRMNMRVLVVAFVIASLAASGGQPAAAPAPAQTLGLDSTQPIAVNADTFLADLNGETGTYTGNVIVEQGAVRLHADEVKVVAPGGKASRMEANGHVIVDSPSGQAVGDNGIYDVPDQLLHLTGNVVLTKDANVMRGNALEVSMATGLAKLTASAANAPPGQPPGRVQGLFVPAQKSPPPAQPAPPGP